jgi:hypothetical protein
MSDLNPGDWDTPAPPLPEGPPPVCIPPYANDASTPEDITARSATRGEGPGRPARSGCASGTWLDTTEGRIWENLTGRKPRSDS